MSLCMKKKKDALSRTLWQTLTYGDQPLADGTIALIDRMPPRASWTFSGAEGSVLGLFGTLSRLEEPQGGQRLGGRMMIFP